ncbi:MAG: hypothetical protein ABI150_08895 [Nitrobacter sp.]
MMWNVGDNDQQACTIGTVHTRSGKKDIESATPPGVESVRRRRWFIPLAGDAMSRAMIGLAGREKVQR